MHRGRHHVRSNLAVRLLLLIYCHTIHMMEGGDVIPVDRGRRLQMSAVCTLFVAGFKCIA